MEGALSRGDAAAIRREFSQVQELRRGIPPGSMAAEHVYLETWLLLQAGDTAAATLHADEYLVTLPTLRETVISDAPEQASALVRLMALRADLGAIANDRVTARRWAEPVAILWQDSDPEIQPLVTRMRALAADGGR